MIRLGLAAVISAAVLASCARPDRLPGAGDLLFLSSRAGLLALDVESGRALVAAQDIAHNLDWSRVFLAVPEAGKTRVVLQDLATNARREVSRVSGTLSPAVVSRSGQLVALTKPRVGRGASSHAPRSRTVLAVLRLSGEVRRFDLAGNFDPEAFTVDDRTMVLLEYVPATRPDRYRLRELDLATGTVGPLGARLKLLAPDEMRATGRTQTPAPDGDALYTLYTRQGPNLAHLSTRTVPTPEPVHSFVHVLNLREGFAHCVDLPSGFGAGPSAIAVSADGARLFVADARNLVVVDTHSLRVAAVAPIREGDPTSLFSAAQGGPRGRLFVASGRHVSAVDQATLHTAGIYRLGGDVTGLALSSDGLRLYATLENGIAVVDARTGATIRTLRVQGVTGILAAASR